MRRLKFNAMIATLALFSSCGLAIGQSTGGAGVARGVGNSQSTTQDQEQTPEQDRSLRLTSDKVGTQVQQQEHLN